MSTSARSAVYNSLIGLSGAPSIAWSNLDAVGIKTPRFEVQHAVSTHTPLGVNTSFQTLQEVMVTVVVAKGLGDEQSEALVELLSQHFKYDSILPGGFRIAMPLDVKPPLNDRDTYRVPTFVRVEELNSNE